MNTLSFTVQDDDILVCNQISALPHQIIKIRKQGETRLENVPSHWKQTKATFPEENEEIFLVNYNVRGRFLAKVCKKTQLSMEKELRTGGYAQMQSGMPYEFETTLHGCVLDPNTQIMTADRKSYAQALLSHPLGHIQCIYKEGKLYGRIGRTQKKLYETGLVTLPECLTRRLTPQF